MVRNPTFIMGCGSFLVLQIFLGMKRKTVFNTDYQAVFSLSLNHSYNYLQILSFSGKEG